MLLTRHRRRQKVVSISGNDLEGGVSLDDTGKHHCLGQSNGISASSAKGLWPIAPPLFR